MTNFADYVRITTTTISAISGFGGCITLHSTDINSNTKESVYASVGGTIRLLGQSSHTSQIGISENAGVASSIRVGESGGTLVVGSYVSVNYTANNSTYVGGGGRLIIEYNALASLIFMIYPSYRGYICDARPSPINGSYDTFLRVENQTNNAIPSMIKVNGTANSIAKIFELVDISANGKGLANTFYYFDISGASDIYPITTNFINVNGSSNAFSVSISPFDGLNATAKSPRIYPKDYRKANANTLYFSAKIDSTIWASSGEKKPITFDGILNLNRDGTMKIGIPTTATFYLRNFVTGEAVGIYASNYQNSMSYWFGTIPADNPINLNLVYMDIDFTTS